MRPEKVLLALTLCVAVPVVLQAANVCVWNYDTLDRFYDPGVGDSVDCAYNVERTLTYLGHTFTVSNGSLPTNLDSFDVVFCLMGWVRGSEDNCSVGSAMSRLIDFLDSGHPVYAEGTEFASDNYTTSLWPYFGASWLGPGHRSPVGNVQSLTGEPGSFAEGLSLGYPYQQAPDNWVNELGADSGTVVLRSQDSVGRAVCCNAYFGFRTVLSSTIFSASGGVLSRLPLMAAYMDYLVHGIGINQSEETRVVAPAAVVPSVARVGRVVQFQTSGPARELSVLDITGRVVTNWRIPTGDAVTRWKVGSEVAPGAYFLQVRSSGRADTHPFTMVR